MIKSRMTFRDYHDMWEDAAATNVGGGQIAGLGVGPQGEPGLTPAQIKKHKKRVQKSIYDGRTKEGKKFVERILARRAAREASKATD